MSNKNRSHRYQYVSFLLFVLLPITALTLYKLLMEDQEDGGENFSLHTIIAAHLSFIQKWASLLPSSSSCCCCSTRSSCSSSSSSSSSSRSSHLIQKFCGNNHDEGDDLNKHFIQSLICKAKDKTGNWDILKRLHCYYRQMIERLIRWKENHKKQKTKDYNGIVSKRDNFDLHPYPSVVKTLQNGDIHDRRIGIACYPRQEIVEYEEGVGGHEDRNSHNGPYSGMVLQIFPKQFDLEGIKSFQDTKNDIDISSIELSGGVTSNIDQNNMHQPCKELSTYYLNNNQAKDLTESNNNNALTTVHEYVLLEVMHGSLGNIDFHNQDYAYRPVIKVLGSSSGTTSFHQNYNIENNNAWFWDESGSQSDYVRMGKRAFAGGSHGEVWKARQKCNQVEQFEKEDHNNNHRYKQNYYQKSEQYQHKRYFQDANMCNDKKELILKRIKVGEDRALYEAGLREVYFGDILNRSDESKDLYTTYIDHFFLNQSFMSSSTELWIVYEDAGPSLRSYIYKPITSGDFVLYQQSPLWRRLRLEFASRAESNKSFNSVAIVSDYGTYTKGITSCLPDGSERSIHIEEPSWNDESRSSSLKSEVASLVKDILMQIIKSASKLHERGIVHRDIKPSNIMCRTRNDFEKVSVGVKCVLGDFSSARDDFSSENFYSKGPSAAEQTNEYAPPEALFAEEWAPFDKAKPESYDSWSIGVVILELLLGTPNVFSVDQRTTTLLTNKLRKEGASEADIQRALYLAALSQFCIYVPTNESDKGWPLRKGDPLFKASIVKKTCTIHDFHSALRARDPLGIGFDTSVDPLLQLIWGLLAWNPKDRLTASEAMDHFYFTNDYLEDGEHNALEPQMLDPRLDTDIEEGKVNVFVCPKCGRKFDNLQSCQSHATGRRHSKFCTYDRSLLPKCLNAHSMLPSHPTSGYCDIQGRRRVIEDFHTVHLAKDHQFFGVFDGHNGNLASKYAASELYKEFVKHLGDIDDDINNGTDWKIEVTDEMNKSFEELHRGVLDAIKSYPTGTVMSKSGTTATALFVTEYSVVVASVGDSRAVLSVGTSFDTQNQASSIQLTFDHVASNQDERKRIEDLGGVLSSRGGVLRVNGTLVLSRSIGDAHLEEFLSRTPNVVAMTKEEVKDKCTVKNLTNAQHEMPCFIILASDGLWDVFTNQEAVDLVEQVIQKYDPMKGNSWEEDGGAFQDAAEVLTQEAYVRGSTDNIGVCVVAIM